MAKWTCKGRVREWLETQRLLNEFLPVERRSFKGYLAPTYDPLHRAITKLLHEAFQRGYEKGYKAGKGKCANGCRCQCHH